jgi:hypothetical protein
VAPVTTPPPPSPVPAPPKPRQAAPPAAKPTPPPPKPTPPPTHAPKPTPSPTPTPQPPPPPKPTPSPKPTPTPPPPPAPVAYKLNSLGVTGFGDQTRPTIRPSARAWWWDRWGLGIGGTRYANGITVHAPSNLTIDLHRSCVAYDARAGVDDLTRQFGAVRFSVYGDGTPLWASGVVRGGDPAVPLHVPITGYRTIRLVVQPEGRGLGIANLADWADSVISCS